MSFHSASPAVTRKTLTGGAALVGSLTGTEAAQAGVVAYPVSRAKGSLATCIRMAGVISANSAISAFSTAELAPHDWARLMIGGGVIVTNFDADYFYPASAFDEAISCLSVKSGATENAVDRWWKSLKGDVAKWTKIDQRIETIATYERGWDGDDAAPISPATILTLKQLNSRLQALHAPAPSNVIAYDDGELEIQWDCDAFFAALSVDASQSLVGFVRTNSRGGPLSIECSQPQKADLRPFVQALMSR